MIGPLRMQNRAQCRECSGTGTIIANKCRNCNGEGRVKEEVDFKVKIPKGISDNTRIRLKGKGNAGKNNNESGDLYVFVTVEEHEFFERFNENLLTTVDISYSQAVLGDKININTFSGDVMMKIPKSTQPDTVFRLKDKGLPVMDSDNYGDLLVKVNIKVPEKISQKEEELISKLGRLEGRKVKPRKGFFERLREHLK